MIIIDLRCDSGHRFEAWFASNESFCDQQRGGLVVCAHCGSPKVERVPSVVHIGGTGESAKAAPNVVAPESPLALYHRFVTAILSSSENTGADFANEARRIHYQETPARPIHGQSTPEEFESLRDEGIDVLRLPVTDKDKLN